MQRQQALEFIFVVQSIRSDLFVCMFLFERENEREKISEKPIVKASKQYTLLLRSTTNKCLQ